MGDLLASGFHKLLKSQVFQGSLIFCLEFPVFEYFIMRYMENINSMDYFLNLDFVLFGIISAVFISIFIGTEYSDGTIRNKLIAGHSRTAIYISNLLICIVAEFFMQMAYLLPLVIVTELPGIIHRTTYTDAVSGFIIPKENIFEMQLIGFYIIAAYCAIFIFVSILITSKPTATVVAMSIAMVMFIQGISITQKVSPNYTNIDEIDSVKSSYSSVEQMQSVQELERGWGKICYV